MSTLKVKGISAPTGYNLQMPAGHIVQVVNGVTSTSTSIFSTFSTIASTFNTSIFFLGLKLNAKKRSVTIPSATKISRREKY